MLQKIKSVFREIRDGEPGRRFLDHYENSRRKEGGRSRWRTWGYVVVGLVLLIAGLALSLPPGVPGFLLWIPGLAFIAARSRRVARLLDRTELMARNAWERVRGQRRP